LTEAEYPGMYVAGVWQDRQVGKVRERIEQIFNDPMYLTQPPSSDLRRFMDWFLHDPVNEGSLGPMSFCKGSGFCGCVVYFVGGPVVNLRPSDIIIYLVDDLNSSLIRRTFPSKISDLDSAPHATGNTVKDGKTLSEVYVNHPFHDHPFRLAHTIVHEAMHNKTQLGNAALHDKAVFAGRNGGFAQIELPRDLDLPTTSVDRDLMRLALARPVLQVVGL
jgi:hypothetical protein